MTVCGYIYDHTATPADKDNLVGYENWIKGLIVHDESVGPYRVIPTDLDARDKLLDKGYSDLLLPPNWPDENTEFCTAGQIEGVIVPLPEKAYLTGEFVYEIIDELLEENDRVTEPLLKATEQGNKAAADFLTALRQPCLGTCLVHRAYFIESQSYKLALRKAPLAGSLHHLVRDTYLSMQMSRLVWVIELTLAEEMRKEREGERRVYGEIILDSTASPYAPSFLAIHLPSVLHIRDPKDEAWRIISLPNDTPYSYPRDFGTDYRETLVN